ncbi:MAG: hypothetical protein HOU81_11480 [Hamadaea sp.]|uniref:hypothetical protein n=1 Tax=Hamadaea sp. TaxID=2024425 RepID=UPI0017A3E079|nr:hypothetical protein [Hamadaea sp.]NUR71433.1 hypothetical protein [Hamadaea sp.]NUT23743.1 hypothetical protein [Hamadaea sp.]
MSSLRARWPSALGLVSIAGAVFVLVLSTSGDLPLTPAVLFGPAIATMAGIYLMAYALGRPRTAWVAFVVLSVVVSVFQVLYQRSSGLHPAVGMSAVLVLLWVWVVLARRELPLQTVGMVFFGALSLLCAFVEPRLGIAVAGAGFLFHGAWDAYHFAVDRVVDRRWSEYCGVVDLGIGVALFVAALVG